MTGVQTCALPICIIYNSQDMEATKMSINKRMDKEDVVHIYNGILAIERNEIGSFVETWMDLETHTE